MIKNIDLSNNTSLENLELGVNMLETIDLSNNVNLVFLRINKNKLTNLDISNNVALENLDVSGNNLTSLDISNNALLGLLYAYNNKLTSLRGSDNPKVSIMYLYNNELESLILNKDTIFNGLILNNNNFMNNINLSVDETVNLSDYIVLPDSYEVTYEIEDEDIATLSDGKIKGVKDGVTKAVLTISGSNVCTGDDCSSSDSVVFTSNIKVSKDVKDDKKKDDEGVSENPKTGSYSLSFGILIITFMIGYLVLSKKDKISKI